MMDEDTLIDLQLVITKLPNAGKSESVLLNISRMDNNILQNLWDNLFSKTNDEEKMQVLRKFRVLTK